MSGKFRDSIRELERQVLAVSLDVVPTLLISVRHISLPKTIAGARPGSDAIDKDIELAAHNVADLGMRVSVDRTNAAGFKVDLGHQNGVVVSRLLSNKALANGKVDEKDHPQGYSGDAMYFKAGAYNQCSTRNDPAFWYPACEGSGDWETDKANGDYVAVAFRRIRLTRSIDPKK